jgi:hypothetical protein
MSRFRREVKQFMHVLKARERGLETELHIARRETEQLREKVQGELGRIRVQATLRRQEGPNLKRKRERQVSAGAVGAAYKVCDRIEAVLNPPQKGETNGTR